MEEPNGAGRAVDIQSHWLPDSYFRAISDEIRDKPKWSAPFRGLLSAGPDAPLRKLEERLPAMDQAGIGVAVLSVTPCTFRRPARAIKASSTSNDDLIEAAAHQSSTFRVLASLPLPFEDQAVAELERIGKNPMVVGVIVPSTAPPYRLDHPRFRSVFAAAANLHLPVVIHPALEPLDEGFADWGLDFSLAPPLLTSVAAIRLVFAGLLDELPELELIVPHLGGVLPYLVQRLVDQSGRGGAAKDIQHYLRSRLYYDNCSYHKPALECAIATFGAGRLMVGSDYPFRGGVGRCVADIESSELDDHDRRSILFGTAERVLTRRTRQPLV